MPSSRKKPGSAGARLKATFTVLVAVLVGAGMFAVPALADGSDPLDQVDLSVQITDDDCSDGQFDVNVTVANNNDIGGPHVETRTFLNGDLIDASTLAPKVSAEFPRTLDGQVETHNFELMARVQGGNSDYELVDSVTVNSPCSTTGPTDTDSDGVPDGEDAFPNNPNESEDSDGDGVGNNADQCDNEDGPASNNGCPLPPADDDNDGVPNGQDNCANTPAGAAVDQHGCSASQRDSDGDGVNDAVDQCPGTPAGTEVGSDGCPVEDDGNGNDNGGGNNGGDNGNDDSAKNHPEYWENQYPGTTCVKYDNVNALTFTVPAAPDDTEWVVAVVKAGSKQSVDNPNHVDETVRTGDVLSHPSGKNISHVILCHKPVEEDTEPEPDTYTNPQLTLEKSCGEVTVNGSNFPKSGQLQGLQPVPYQVKVDGKVVDSGQLPQKNSDAFDFVKTYEFPEDSGTHTVTATVGDVTKSVTVGSNCDDGEVPPPPTEPEFRVTVDRPQTSCQDGLVEATVHYLEGEDDVEASLTRKGSVDFTDSGVVSPGDSITLTDNVRRGQTVRYLVVVHLPDGSEVIDRFKVSRPEDCGQQPPKDDDNPSPDDDGNQPPKEDGDKPDKPTNQPDEVCEGNLVMKDGECVNKPAEFDTGIDTVAPAAAVSNRSLSYGLYGILGAIVALIGSVYLVRRRQGSGN